MKSDFGKQNILGKYLPPNTVIPLFAVHMPEEVDEPLLKTLHSGYIGQGPKVEEFEGILKAFFGTKNVLTLNSGTSAIHLALRLAGVGPGDEVISTPMTCSASNVPILAHYADIVWADIDPKNGLMDPLDVERKITSKTKAIVCVDWAGTPCDMDRLMAIGQKYGVKVIEDAAHAFGATYKDKRVGNVADFTCFSLQAIKHITTIDGGLLMTKSSNDHDKGKILRWYGIDREATNKDSRIEIDILDWGYKFHMNDITATIGIVQMNFIEKILKAHRENAKFYSEQISNPLITHTSTGWQQNSTFWIYTMLLPTTELRMKFMDYMKANGVMTSRVHGRNDIHATFSRFSKNLPGVTEFDSRQIAIPVHWKLTAEQRKKIADLCNSFGNEKNIIDLKANTVGIRTNGNVYIKPVANLEEALVMRTVRNECNKFMTHDTSTISIERQVNWFLENYKKMSESGEMNAYLLYKADGKAIGYGIVRLKDRKYWLTGGLVKKERGNGFGEILFKQLIDLAPKNEVWLDVLKTNKPGIHVYEKLGFKEVETTKNDKGKKLVIMKFDKNDQ